MFNIFCVAIGGGIGASLRYLFSLFAKKHFSMTYWATFFINILGCLFLGFVATLAVRHPVAMHSDLTLFLTAGIAGGFTTFSTFSYENITLLQDSRILTSIFYMLASLFCGLLGIYLGYLLANLI